MAADNPHANKAMVQMMAVFAEMERDAISKRTKEALVAAKERGVKLGNPRLARPLRPRMQPVPQPLIASLPMSARSSGKSRKVVLAASVALPRRCLRAGSRSLVS